MTLIVHIKIKEDFYTFQRCLSSYESKVEKELYILKGIKMVGATHSFLYLRFELFLFMESEVRSQG